MPEQNDDGYTTEPTHLRIYQDYPGDEFAWAIDGADDEGRYTEAVDTYSTMEECIAHAGQFIRDTEADGVVWRWTQGRPTTRLRPWQQEG